VLGSPHSRLDRCHDPAINMLILPRSEATEAHGSALPRLQVAPTRRARTRWFQARGLEAGYRGANCAQGMRGYIIHSRERQC